MAEGRRVKPLSSGSVLQNNEIFGLSLQLGLDPREQTPSHAKGPPRSWPHRGLAVGKVSPATRPAAQQ